MELDKISQIAQEISFAYEDQFADKNKREIFEDLFERYLAPVDPSDKMEPYDLIIKLGRSLPDEFNKMLKEMKEAKLIPD